MSPRTAPLLACLLALAATAAGAQEGIPPNDGWVTDLAGLLTPDQERALESLMESYRTGSTHEIALLTVPELGGRPIERFALETARAWKIGTVERNNGALLVVARAERKIRIEVGRGLEGMLTDSISGRIIRGVIAPEFKAGRYYEGLRAGVEAMHAAAGGEYAKIERERASRDTSGVGVIPFVLFLLLVILLSRRGGRGRGGRTGGILPWLLLGSMSGRRSRGWSGGGGGGGFGGFGGGGGFSGGGATGGW